MKHRLGLMTFVSAALVLFLFQPLMNAEETADAPASPQGEAQTGLIQIDAKKEVFLYVPTKYKPGRAYALTISFPREGERPEEHVKSWSAMAERMSFLVLSPAFDVKSGDTPYLYDEWLIKIKNDLKMHYTINSNKVYLIGQDSAAHYAAYLGIKHAKEFSGVGLINQAWNGPYFSLLNFSKNAENQVPFYVAVGPSNRALLNDINSTAVKLQEKGYPIQIDQVATDEELGTKVFREKMNEWLGKKSEAWQDAVKNQPKTFKQKFWGVIRNNVVIE